MTRKRKSIAIVDTAPLVIEYGTKEYDNEFYKKFLCYVEKTTDKVCKHTVINYLKTINKPYLNLETMHSKNFKSVGLYLKMEQDGIRLPVTEKTLLESGIQNFIRLDAKRGIELQQNKKNKSIQEKYFVEKIISEILSAIDNQITIIQKNQRPILDFKTFIGNFSSGIIKLVEEEMKSILQQNVKELKLAKTKKDLQLVEGYSYLTPKQLKSLLEFYELLLRQLQTGLVIRTKKPRKLKQKTPDKLVKKLKYMEKFSDLGLFSVNPTELVGANIVYVYNTKTRFIQKFESDIGVGVRGSTLINIKEPAIKKKIRNPEVLKSINTTNRNFMERFWSSFKTKQGEANSRINSNCILLSCINNKNES
jgi:hypothetical protein